MENEFRRILGLAAGHRQLLQRLDDVLLTTTQIEKDTDLSKFPKRRDVALFLFRPGGLGIWTPLEWTQVLGFGTLSLDAYSKAAEERLADAGFTQVSLAFTIQDVTTVLATLGPYRIRLHYRQISMSEQSDAELLQNGSTPLIDQLQAPYINQPMPERVHKEVIRWYEPYFWKAEGWKEDLRCNPKVSSIGDFDQAVLFEFGAPIGANPPREFPSGGDAYQTVDLVRRTTEYTFRYEGDEKWKSRPWPRLFRCVFEEERKSRWALGFVYMVGLCKREYDMAQKKQLLDKWRQIFDYAWFGYTGSDSKIMSGAEIEIVDVENLATVAKVLEEEQDPQEPKIKALTTSDTTDTREKVKLRPANDVYNRIKWDGKFDVSDYVIGYLDRFEGIKEVPMEEWVELVEEEYFVPMHRIRYFKRIGDGEVVWDREKRVDKIF